MKPLVPFAISGGRCTVFAYGQTGSGKTYTMQGIQQLMTKDLFYYLLNENNNSHIEVVVSYFEIYGGRCQDLLNNRERLNVREDGNGEVIVSELLELKANDEDELQSIIDTGNRNRTTHATESNDESSRSHAVCLILLKNINNGKLIGKLSLIDLAGSERGADTKSHNRQRRMEGAEINKSLLALKECIRALNDGGSTHVPYRASKLTLVLKDSFTRNSARTVMIATVSPAASSADHTQNTLRYADRVKERVVGGQAAKNVPMNNLNPSNIAMSKDDSNAKLSNIPSNKQQQHKQISPASNIVAQHQPKLDRNNYNDHDNDFDSQDQGLVDEFHQTIQDLFDDEEELLNLHMNIIQENAELLTEEGRLLQQIQGDDYDIDSYTTRLDQILLRKEELIILLKTKLSNFRSQLIKEEATSRKLGNIASY